MRKKNTGICLLLFFFLPAVTEAQEQPPKGKVVKTVEQINKKSAEVNASSNQVMQDAQQVAGNLKQTVQNVKTIISVFEPILRFRLKKKSAAVSAVQAGAPEDGATLPPTARPDPEPLPQPPPSSAVSQPVPPAESVAPIQGVTEQDIQQGLAVPESPLYNTDGTANLGTQNHKSFGCYLDMSRGAVLDDIDAAGNSRSVDLIFTATGSFNEQLPMYALLTPAYVKNDPFAYNYFKGVKYKDKNIPPAAWEAVNESEVALTALTLSQFDKIKDNNQLMAVVKQVRGFGVKVESRAKLEGKVLAVKTEMGDRTVYGLICIISHIGTTGENGYLKIRIKVTGFDSNGDGQPDAGIYQ